MSGTGGDDDVVVGPALQAHLLPLRVTKPGLFPSPVLVCGGMPRLRDAVYYAIAQQCDVISISLGGLKFRRLHKALIKAREAGVIVCAAAGNKVSRNNILSSCTILPRRIGMIASRIAVCGLPANHLLFSEFATSRRHAVSPYP